MLRQKPFEYTCDDITIVTMLEADDNISVSYVDTDDDVAKSAKNTHCTWHLSVRGYTPEELDEIVEYIGSFGGKCSSDERQFSFRCPECGVGWITDGPCGDECSDMFLGRLPDFHLFDAVKKAVIAQKRQAQEELARERKEGPLYLPQEINRNH